MIVENVQVVERIVEIRDERQRKNDRGVEIAPPQEDERNRKHEAAEDITLVHARRQHEIAERENHRGF